ncbi:MAG: U32 family peptidase [Clostridia bacterium]|nr:U32 family peptidase [Clostridia bacterium]
MNQIEILSPAGSFEALKAAIESGADAVYFGGRAFSARKNAVNLSNEEITEAVAFAHLRGAKLYAAVNTLMFDNELSDAFEFIKFCYEAGVDALIVQDLGLVNILRRYFPDFPIHASTQMTIHNLSGAIAAKKMGFKRVVLSRELSLNDISHIAANCDIELEVFVHGALCMSYSGQCLMSSFLGGRSGNRGSCAQPCRLNYTLFNSSGERMSDENKYLLSLKDLCLIDHISDLKKAGVTSLKIEGRMKSAAYVSAVSGIYNKYRGGGKVSQDDKLLLENIFSRGGFTQGYFKEKTGREMLSFDKNHDDIFASATEDVLTKSKSLANIDHKNKIDAIFKMKNGEPVFFEAKYLGKIYSAKGEINAEPATNAAVDSERIKAQLEKLGSTTLEFSSLELDVEEGLYIPIKEINLVRRLVCEKIEKAISGSGRKYEGEAFKLPPKPQAKQSPLQYSASVLNEAQADICYELGFDIIYIPYHIYLKNKQKFDSEPEIFCVKLPPVNHDSKEIDYSAINVNSVCITNLAQLEKTGDRFKKYADYRLNICNSFSLKQASKLGISRACVSPEMTLSSIGTLRTSLPMEILVYGKVSLMTVKNCLVKSSLGKCGCKEGEIYYLRDRKNICFPVECVKGECINIIYNSAPIYMADRMKEIKRLQPSFYRFDFTDEAPQEIAAIMKQYEKGEKSPNFFTRGHFYNGVN